MGKNGRPTNETREARRAAKDVAEFRSSVPRLLAKTTRRLLDEGTSPAVHAQLVTALGRLCDLLPSGALQTERHLPADFAALAAQVRGMPREGQCWGEWKTLTTRLAETEAALASCLAKVRGLESENGGLRDALREPDDEAPVPVVPHKLPAQYGDLEAVTVSTEGREPEVLIPARDFTEVTVEGQTHKIFHHPRVVDEGGPSC